MLSDLVENCAVALFRPKILMAALDISMENVPELMALDLSHSNLFALDNLTVLALKVPNFKVLHSWRNQVITVFSMIIAIPFLSYVCVSASFLPKVRVE
jgi:hypothetical protein